MHTVQFFSDIRTPVYHLKAFLLSSFTLISELYPKERRIIMSCTFMVIWAAHTSSLGLIAYMLKDFSWNTLFLFTAVLSVYFPVDYLVVNTASLNAVLLMVEVLIGSIYINYSVMALLEIVTAASYMAIAERFGHKMSLQAWKTLVTVSLFSASMIKIFAGNSEMTECIIPVLYFLAVSGLNAGSGGDYIYTSELFPTQLRSVGSGFATTLMRATSMAAPFLKLLWDLVCNNLGLAESTQTVYALGQVVSGLLAPYLIEKFGRKPTRVTSNILLVVLNLIAAYSPFYWLFTTMRFFAGIVREAYLFSSINLICELYAKERRIIMSSTFMCIWAIYTSSLGFIAYMLKDYSWNTIFLFNAVISGYFLVDFLAVNAAAWNSMTQMLEVLTGSIYLNFFLMSIVETVSLGVYSAIAKRSVGNGIATTFMRTLCMISPFLKLLAMAFPWAPGVIIGASCIVTSILIQVFLPETGNRVLPQRIEDLKMAEKKNKRNDIKMQGVS
ncbi:solute carrier family 22 member 8-like [Octopus vulgaris]|uniref:Solute carrier family 22 member 8-like n=1 Tax=Octopus vulgaris TaxID=6645 RepID=A0AA36BA82_OCTVU|nr:solute carrier family 22 member 8-like [Octopus vulgaris]